MTRPLRLAIVRQRYSVHGGAERFVARAVQALSARQALEVTLLAREAWERACHDLGAQEDIAAGDPEAFIQAHVPD